MSRNIVAAAVIVLSIGGASSCGGNNNGTLVPTWTIAGTTEPAACTGLRASQMRLVVLDSAGFVQATQFAPCTDFRTELTLHEDAYSATATFLDPSNVVVSKTLVISRFTVLEAQTTTLTVPFQVTDFF
jgi:hypothetical protein